jgi:CRP-like cAMP-binding protein
VSNKEALVAQIQDTCKDFVSALTKEEIETFVDYTTLVEVGSREVFAEIGDVQEEFYLILGGEIRLFKDDAGQEVDVGQQAPGNLVGHMSFFDRKPRTLRLRARKSGARMLSISRPMYRRLTVEHPYIAVNLLEFVILSLDRLVRTASDDITNLQKQVAGFGYR